MAVNAFNINIWLEPPHSANSLLGAYLPYIISLCLVGTNLFLVEKVHLVKILHFFLVECSTFVDKVNHLFIN